MFKVFIFWVFFFSSILISILFVTRRNPVHAALLLALNFVVVACLYVLLSAQFVAVAQVMIYAGAIMMFFLYIIMHIGLSQKATEPLEIPLYKIAGFIFAILIFFELLFFLARGKLLGIFGCMTPEAIKKVGDIETFGIKLYTKYLLAFEFVSILLLAGIVGAVILAKRRG